MHGAFCDVTSKGSSSDPEDKMCFTWNGSFWKVERSRESQCLLQLLRISGDEDDGLRHRALGHRPAQAPTNAFLLALLPVTSWHYIVLSSLFDTKLCKLSSIHGIRVNTLPPHVLKL